MHKLCVNADVAPYQNSLYLLLLYRFYFRSTGLINQVLVDFVAESMKIALQYLLTQTAILICGLLSVYTIFICVQL